MLSDFGMIADDNGWITIQRRIDNTVSFYLYWDDYVNGFGNDEGNFWLGLERIHCLTARGPTEVYIVLEAYDGTTAYAAYDRFSISDSETKYVLTLGTYSGTAGDDFTYNAGQKFSTRDQDNTAALENCGVSRRGAWWYKGCTWTNLNGLYNDEGISSPRGIQWNSFKDNYSLYKTEIKIRLL